MTNPDSPDRIILVDKPAGISSFGVVARVRRQLRDEFGRKIKVGHTGTLDPFATGLLILLSGKNTKKSAEFLKLDKTYEATLKLGFTSTTGDPEGAITPYQTPVDNSSTSEHESSLDNTTPVTNSNPDNNITPISNSSTKSTLTNSVSASIPVPIPSLAEIEAVLQQFTGKQLQTVPKFSAVKINGRRAYQLARQGANFETPTREITVYNLETLNYDYPELKIRCRVSSGTYIRTLAEDIGQKLDTGAYLTALRRTEVGPYSVQNAQKL